MQQQRRDPEIDLEQILNRISAALSGFARRFGGGSGGSGGTAAGGGRIFVLATFGILGVSLIIWLSTGIYQVSPGEQAVLRTFGKCCKTAGTGLHWYWPAPIGTKNVESVEEIRTMRLGFAEPGADVSSRGLLLEAQMIAGDLNIVDVPLVVQFRIKNLQKFLFNVADPGETVPPGTRDIPPGRPEGRTLKDATEAALRLVVGQRAIDDVLTDKKEEVQADTQELLQGILDSYGPPENRGAGIEITQVLLQEVKAPAEVRDAFEDVNRARQDQETIINQAQAYERDLLPRARGEKEKIVQAAEAFRQERIAKAEGEAGKFLSILREFEKAENITRQRLYLEAMEEILPGIAKFVVSPEAQGGLILNAGSQIVPVARTSATGSQLAPTPVPAGGQ